MKQSWIDEDVYKNEMQPLKRKYARFLRSKNENPRKFNKCWAEYQAKTGRRLAQETKFSCGMERRY